jgi:hypothetical protein
MQCTHTRAREVSLQLLCSGPLADGVVIPRNGFPPIGPKGGEALVSERYISRAASAASASFINRLLRLPVLETICPLLRAGEAPETALSGSILEKKRQTRNRV